MSAPSTPLEVIQQLTRLVASLDSVSTELSKAEIDAVHAAKNAERSYDLAYMAASGPVEARKATARLQGWQAALDADLADVTVRRLKRDLDIIRMRIDVGRTYSATVRAELASLGNPY